MANKLLTHFILKVQEGQLHQEKQLKKNRTRFGIK